MTEEAYSLIAIIDKVKGWHHDRNLIDGASDKDQYMKLIQEAGELSDNICKGNDIKDDIGDMLVVLINIAERNGLSLTECLLEAWHDIKDRKGMMVDGVFVKEEDGLVPAHRSEESTSSHYQEEWDWALAEYMYEGEATPVTYSNGDTTREIGTPDRRATGSLDGPGFDLDTFWDELDSEKKEDIYKNTVFGTTRY